MEINKKGTHQLAFRLISMNVLLGAKNVFTRRCGSERPGPAGSGAVGWTGVAYIGGGGGVGPVGELINHPTCEIVESYCTFRFPGISQKQSALLLKMFPSALWQRLDFAIVTQNLYCRGVIFAVPYLSDLSDGNSGNT